MKEGGVSPLFQELTQMQMGFSHTKGWIFGYKLHMVCRYGSSTVVPLMADVTTANVPNNQVYPDLISYVYLQKQ